MKRYPVYKDSGVEWLGKIPEHWETKRLKFIVSNVIEQKKIKTDLEVYVALEHIESWTGKLKQPDEEVIFESTVKRFCPNDVLFGKLRPYLAKAFLSDQYGVCSGELLVFRGKKNILDPKFILLVLLSKPFIDIVNSSTYGSKMPRASWEFIGNLGFQIPPLEEQKAIAHFLDHKLEQIEQYIRNKKRIIELLNEQKTAIINRAVTKGINPNAPMKHSGIEWLGEIPEHWEVIKLGRLCKVTKLTGFEYTKLWKTDPQGEIIALRGLNIKNNRLIIDDVERISAELSNQLNRSKLFAGDIVFPCTGTLGHGALIEENDKFHINQNIAKITPTESFNSEFLLYVLCCSSMQYQINRLNSSGLQPV